MLAAKDSKPVTSGERETTTTEREKSSTTSTPQPSGLGELAATATAPAGRGQGAGSSAAGSGWFRSWSRQVGNVPRRGQPKVIAYTGYETDEVCPGDLGGA